MNSQVITILATMLTVVFAAVGIAQDDAAPDFVRDFRPILSNKCFTCHGPDANTREGGFRLDLKTDQSSHHLHRIYPLNAQICLQLIGKPQVFNVSPIKTK